MSEVKSINNLKEVLRLVFAIAVPIIKESRKDGFQWTDILAFLGSEDFKATIGPALTDLGEIPAELKDFSLEEGFELAGVTLEEIRKLLSAILSK
jgi:hypothetical protein